jgi:hypothetical protein
MTTSCALARSSPRSSLRVQRFRHASESYIGYEGGIPAFKPRNPCCNRLRCQCCDRRPMFPAPTSLPLPWTCSRAGGEVNRDDA